MKLHPFLIAIVALPAIAIADGTTSFERDIKPILKELCFECHGPDKQKADIRMDTLDPDIASGKNVETWHDVMDQVNLNEMPPKKAKPMSSEQRRAFIAWVAEGLEEAALRKRFSDGRVTTRRLTRYEYQNTMRDLLGLDLDYARDLPPEPASTDGFLNDGRVMEMSPSQIETYLTAARRALKIAIVQGEQPKVIELHATKGATGKLPKKKLAGHVPANPEYLVDIKEFHRHESFEFRIEAGARVPDGFDFPRMRIALGFQPGIIHTPRKTLGEVDVTASADEPATYVFQGRMEDFPQPGDRPFGNTPFKGMIGLIDYMYADGRELRPAHLDAKPPKKNAKKPTEPQKKPEVEETAKAKPEPEVVIKSVSFRTPASKVWPPASHIRILFPKEDGVSDDDYVKAVITRFMSRAFRRPVTDDETSATFELFQRVRSKAPTFEAAMRETLASVLVSPHFLYRVETREKQDKAEPVNNHELASRLSYFLWSSTPDDELIQLADNGKLTDPKTLAAQINRMLEAEGGRRSLEFVNRFADQWFDLKALERVVINSKVHPTFNDAIRTDMRDETRAFLAHILHSNGSMLDLIDSEWTMANRTLSDQYGLTGPRTSKFERVALPPNSRRGGILGQGSFLVSNSNGEVSHPIKRAVWVLDRLLDSPPPPPPPDVPELEPDSPNMKGLTVKQQLAVHREKEACNDCHQGIDPWGIPFERFDAVGNWRDTFDNPKQRKDGQPVAIDASSQLPDGTTINGVVELKAYILEHHRDSFARCVVKRLITFALGRSLDFGDRKAIEELTDSFIKDEFRLRPLITHLVLSDTFLTK